METFISFLQGGGGGHQEFSKGHIKCHESQNTFILLMAACYVIRCLALHSRRMLKQPKTSKEPFPPMQATFAHAFSRLNSPSHIDQYIVVISNAYSSNLVCVNDTLVTNLAHTASISHVRRTFVCNS